MIRCDIVKGKMAQPQSLNKPPWDPTPRNADGFVLDLGNIGDPTTSPPLNPHRPITLFDIMFTAPNTAGGQS